MDKKNDMKNQCPSFDDLSAWYDNETAGDFQSHVDECGQCGEVLKCFESYDRSISGNAVASDRQLQRINRRCLEELRSNPLVKPRMLSVPIFVKIAACAMLIGMVVVLNKTTHNLSPKEVVQAPVVDSDNKVAADRQTKITKDVVSNKKIPVAISEEIDKPQTVGEMINDSPSLVKESHSLPKQHKKIAPQSQLELPAMQLVGFGYEGARRAGSSKIENIKNDSINDYVHHVWLVDDPSLPLQSLKNILPNHIGVLEGLINEHQDRYHLQFKIVDRNLKSLVDHFDGLGFQLLRPDNPQPGADNIVKFDEKFVQYDVDFVKE